MATAVAMAVLALLLLPLGGVSAAADGKPDVKLSKSQAGTGGSITVTGTGWRSKAILMMLVCGQSSPDRGVIGGTNSCANADGRAVTTDSKGRFSKKLPVVEPPEPCPCVVHVATVTGEKAAADAAFLVAGHDVEPLPKEATGGRLSVLTDTRLDGSSGVLTWFGAPPSRDFVFTVGNVGSTAVKDPVFQVGTSHGVFAPQWEEQQWRGTIEPGKKAQVELPVELSAGAHGEYTVSVKYGGKVLAEQPWGVGRPWGVTLFWILLCVVVPAAVFRIGMAVVDRVRPQRSRSPGRWRSSPRSTSGGGHAGPRRGLWLPEVTVRLPKLSLTSTAPSDADRSNNSSSNTSGNSSTDTTPTLPWFTPDTDPGAEAGQLSAPHENSPTTPTRKGNT
ncbi:hypothetical protein G5C60_45785 [Streptomyces sp. HC44]|uniref:Neocarzinostatin family protein n=1 Tax=Streptomyces scabichelini TaxID=2711217 RepID=A0A6G4VLP7_9ACTN|nr:hypothetical protein [Streptomyces scabichelini]NGO14714.1 hypothetical protein [Streptomyces scabichelini]